MRLLSALILAFAVISTKALGCDPDLPACSDVSDIAKIKCPKTSGDCTLECPEGEEEGIKKECSPELKTLLLGEPPIQNITADECRDKCKVQAESPEADPICQFYRWQNDHQDGVHCSLQTTCVSDPTCGGDKYCITGENGCKDGEPDLDCELKKATWEHDKFHVICYSGKDNSDINIYEKDQTVSAGTVCQTVSKCAEWNERDNLGDNEAGPYQRLLAVQCNGNGTWTRAENTGSDDMSAAMIAEGNKILEQTCCVNDDGNPIEDKAGCKCTPLDAPTEDWADLICENPLEDGKVTEANSCYLLCDNHLRNAFSCRLDFDGDKKWLKDIDGTEVTALNCD